MTGPWRPACAQSTIQTGGLPRNRDKFAGLQLSSHYRCGYVLSYSTPGSFVLAEYQFPVLLMLSLESFLFPSDSTSARHACIFLHIRGKVCQCRALPASPSWSNLIPHPFLTAGAELTELNRCPRGPAIAHRFGRSTLSRLSSQYIPLHSRPPVFFVCGT